MFEHLYRPIVFETPELVPASSAWNVHLPFAFWIVDALRPEVFVELGTHTGASYCAFCQAVARLSLPTLCYAVDTWIGDEHAGLYGEEVYQTLAAYHEPRYSAFSRLVRASFDEAVEHFADGSIDLLHIDGLHTYDAVRHDFETWRPKLSDRAVVLFHDTNVRERGFGVWKLWAELAARYPAFSLIHGHGLGVLAVGSDLPVAVRWLVEIPRVGPTAVNAVRGFFVRLGAIAEAIPLVDQLKIEVSQARSEVNARDKLLKDAEIALAQRDERLKALQQELKSLRQSWSWRMTNLSRITPAKLRQRLRLRREAQLIRKSHLFDAKFYLERNPDVKAIGVDPVSHYVQWGASEGRDPHPDFDTTFYVQSNPDVARSGINPLVHYLGRGIADGRKTRAPQNTERT